MAAPDQAVETRWSVYALPEWYVERLPNRNIVGLYRVMDPGESRKLLVARRRQVQANGNGGQEWDCDCRRGGDDDPCEHVAAVLRHLEAEQAQPRTTSHPAGPIQGQAGGDLCKVPDQTPSDKGDRQMSWQNRTFEHADEALSFSFIQWVNDPSSLDPRADRGGFACPVDQNVPIPGQRATIHHRGGDHTDVIFTQTLAVATLRTRFSWVLNGMRQADYVDGARGKLQALGYVVGADGAAVPELVMLTFTGLASRNFGQVRRGFVQSVRRATKGQAPAYAFWMHLAAGPVEMVGSTKQSPITTLELGREADPDSDYVGDELIDGIPWPDVLAWADAWKAPGPNGTGVIHGVDEGEDGSESIYQEGTVEWASELGLPFDGASVSRGTPLGTLSDNALRYVAEHKEREHPRAAKAARVLLRARQEAQAQAQSEQAAEYEPPF